MKSQLRNYLLMAPLATIFLVITVGIPTYSMITSKDYTFMFILVGSFVAVGLFQAGWNNLKKIDVKPKRRRTRKLRG